MLLNIYKKKIIHRNITLKNILLNYDDEEDKKNFNLIKANIKLIDFGFAWEITKDRFMDDIIGRAFNIGPQIFKDLYSPTKTKRRIAFNEITDIWSIGSICYEMLIGKHVFVSDDQEELVKLIEEGTYTIPISMSLEILSFLNGMLQYESKNRLTAEQLSAHDFLIKDIKDFRSIDMQKVSKIVDERGLKISIKNNNLIWSIYNADSENLLTGIVGNQFIKSIDNNKKIEPNVTADSSLQSSSKEIKDNTTYKKVNEINKEGMEINEGSDFDKFDENLFS